MLDQFLEDCGGDDHVKGRAVRRDRASFKAWEWRRSAQRIAQFLIAVAGEVRPHAQGAFVRANPWAELNTLGGEETVLKFTIMGDVDVCTLEPRGDVGQQRRVLNVLIDEMMNGGG